MRIWEIANIVAWILCGLFALLIAADFIHTEKGYQEKSETPVENGGLQNEY